mgnify:CR=1 FL=1
MSGQTWVFPLEFRLQNYGNLQTWKNKNVCRFGGCTKLTHIRGECQKPFNLCFLQALAVFGGCDAVLKDEESSQVAR